MDEIQGGGVLDIAERLRGLIAPADRRVWNPASHAYEYQRVPPSSVEVPSNDLSALLRALERPAKADLQEIVDGATKAAVERLTRITCAFPQHIDRDHIGWSKMRHDDACAVLGAVERMQLAMTELLAGHDNLYAAHFGPGADPRNDIASKAARSVLAALSSTKGDAGKTVGGA